MKVDQLAEAIIADIQAEDSELLKKWQTEGYIPVDNGVLLYVKTDSGQPVVVSINKGNDAIFNLELLRNNDKFDRIVLGGEYGITRQKLAHHIDVLLRTVH